MRTYLLVVIGVLLLMMYYKCASLSYINKTKKVLLALRLVDDPLALIKYIISGGNCILSLKMGQKIELEHMKKMSYRARNAIGVILHKHLEYLINRGEEGIYRAIKMITDNAAEVVRIEKDNITVLVERFKLLIPRSHLLYTLYTIREIYIKRVYGEPVPGTVIDIGAFIGDSTLYLAQKAEKVVAVEPDPRFYQYLQHNISLNGLKDKIHPVNTGIRSKENTNWPDLCTIIESYIPSTGAVNLVKMDCEGCEHYNMDCFNPLRRKVKRYVLECHKNAGNCGQLITELRKAGYTIDVIHEDPVNIIVHANKL